VTGYLSHGSAREISILSPELMGTLAGSSGAVKVAVLAAAIWKRVGCREIAEGNKERPHPTLSPPTGRGRTGAWRVAWSSS